MAEEGEIVGCTDVGVGAQKTASVLLDLKWRQRKLEHLKWEARATHCKALQQKHVCEVASRKRQRDRVMINSYFGISRNSENRGNLLPSTFGPLLLAKSDDQDVATELL